MIINIQECMSNDTGYLIDIASHKNVASWLTGIIHSNVVYMPLECIVKIDDTMYEIIVQGIPSKDAMKNIKKIKTLHRAQFLPNDNVKITIDPFECELFIELHSLS